MSSIRPLKTIQSHLLSPLFGLLVGFIVIFSSIAWLFRSEYSNLSEQIYINSKIGRYVFEISRNRARMLEMLLLFRLNNEPIHLKELNRLKGKRVLLIRQIPWILKSIPPLHSLGASLLGGLEEAQYLQDEMIRAIQNRNMARADEAFHQLSTIFEINSARLKDFSLRLDAELNGNEHDIQDLMVKFFWALGSSIALFAMTILLIAISYRKNVLGPMRNLHRGLQTVARGDMKLQIPMRTAPRELYEMLTEFNGMVKALESTQDELKHAKDEALNAARIKSDFLCNMSHEIRTPMNAIIGMSDMLAGGELTQNQRRYLQILRNAGQMLLNIVNDILDFSKLEGGNFTIDDVPFDVCSLMSRVAEVVEVMAHRKGLGFKYSFEAEPHFWIRGDPKRIEQIVLNVLGNAVKFTESGQVDFIAGVKSNSLGKNLYMRFGDTGIGIAADKISNIFNRFGQADTSITRKFGGTGLGLSIVKQLVHAMKGTISVASCVGKGTEFEVEIPFLMGIPPTESELTRVSYEVSLKHLFFEKSVLLVDDSPDNRFLIEAYLKTLNCKIIGCENGQIAIDIFLKQHFDLVLMDIQMPVLDGYAATAKIREIERMESRRKTPIIALTAYALPKEMQRSYSAGCDMHLTKPIRKNDLFQAISDLIVKFESDDTI